MYAVIESGGKQHRVKEGETLKLEKIEAATGDKFEFERILLVGGGEQGVVLATTHINTRVEARTTLADDNVARLDDFAAVAFYAQAFTLGIATVASTTTCFLVRHDLAPVTR